MFIAEIGINHNGDIEIAKKLIKKAKEAGVDIVKFQKRNPDLCVPEKQKQQIKETPWGKMTYLEYKYKIEFTKVEYDEIDRYCKELDIKWTASVWDIDSLKFILQYDVPFIKIASATITNIPLLKAIKEINIPIVMSTGMSTLDEIDKAITILDKKDLTLLLCNSSYPAYENELDLNALYTLKKLYPNYSIGYSGHEKGIFPSIIAKAMGAEIIERHITLDKNMWGSDQNSSLNPQELKKLIQEIKRIKIVQGKDTINIYQGEELAKKKLRFNI